jgi:hypothetical protein
MQVAARAVREARGTRVPGILLRTSTSTLRADLRFGLADKRRGCPGSEVLLEGRLREARQCLQIQDSAMTGSPGALQPALRPAGVQRDPTQPSLWSALRLQSRHSGDAGDRARSDRRGRGRINAE